ncbi:MAG: anti-sigma factor RsiW, partial [Myxococcota bacterium]
MPWSFSGKRSPTLPGAGPYDRVPNTLWYPESERSEAAVSRRDHDSLMMDYLYDELTSAQREAFEQQMATDPALKAEVESLQGTRVLLQEAAVVDVVPVAPPLLMQNLMREARKAAHLEPQPTLFERFSALLFRPSFGAAALALVVVAVGVNLMQQQATSPNESTPAPASQPTMTVAVADETDKL